MWWECIPSASIMIICMAIPQFTAYHWNQAFFGNHYRRRLESRFERTMFVRDGRLTGAAWIHKGLDEIPDD